MKKDYGEIRQTLRQQMVDLLSGGEWTVREISQELGIREKEVYGHLDHIVKSAAARGLKFTVIPCTCLDCDYVFSERKRLTRPGRCPQCKGSHLEAPRFKIG